MFFAKYSLNGLSIGDFRVSYVGNLLNISLTLLIIIGLIIQILNLNNSKLKQGLTAVSISAFYLSASVAFLFIGFNDIKFGTSPILNYPPQKMIMGILAISSILLQLYISIFIWGMMIYKGKYLFVKSFTFLMFISFLSMVFGVLYTSTSLGNQKIKIKKKHYDYAVVLGAAVWNKNQPSPLFSGRINTAKNLLSKRIVDKIFLTGGNAPGEVSEARAAYQYLINHSVDKSFLSFEENTNTTSEQIRFIKMKDSDVAENGEVIKKKLFLIISDGFHLARVKEMCKFYGVNADTYSSENSAGAKLNIYHSLRESVGLFLFWLFSI